MASCLSRTSQFGLPPMTLARRCIKCWEISHANICKPQISPNALICASSSLSLFWKAIFHVEPSQNISKQCVWPTGSCHSSSLTQWMSASSGVLTIFVLGILGLCMGICDSWIAGGLSLPRIELLYRQSLEDESFFSFFNFPMISDDFPPWLLFFVAMGQILEYLALPSLAVAQLRCDSMALRLHQLMLPQPCPSVAFMTRSLVPSRIKGHFAFQNRCHWRTKKRVARICTSICHFLQARWHSPTRSCF